MPIPFTQYLLPDGRRKTIHFEATSEYEKKANDLIAAGYVFEVEVLTNGIVSLEVVDGSDEDREAVAAQLSVNGPPIVAKVRKMIDEAHNAVFPKTEDPHGAKG